MEVTINLMDLLLVFLGLAGMVLIIYLIITLVRLQHIMREANRIMAEARGPVSETLRKLPALMDRVSEIGVNVEKLTAAISEDVPVMLKDVRQVTTSTREGVEAIGGVVSEVGGGVKNVFSSFHDHAGTIGTAVSVMSDVIKAIGMLRQHQKSKKSVFGRRKKRR